MDILPDILAPGLRLVVCGSAAGTESARAGAYYAGPGNRFWQILHRTGITPSLLRPQDFRAVLMHGVGLTDIAKKTFGSDVQLRAADFDRVDLRRRIENYEPAVLAFNGKRAAAAYFGCPVDYGYQHGHDVGMTQIFVAPSTSGAAKRFWDEAIWAEVAEAVSARSSPIDHSTGDRFAARTSSGG